MTAAGSGKPMRPVRALLACAVVGAMMAFTEPAAAQIDDDADASPRSFESAEHFGLEFRIGPYSPDMGGNDAFDTFFDDDIGPMLAIEFDVIAWRLPKVLSIAGGGIIGRAGYDGTTLSATGVETSEETTFEIIPLDLLLVLRIDALSRQLSVPLNFAGKIGYQWAHWDTNSGGHDDASGWSRGLVWAAQFALDLDTLEPRQARMLDEEYGINHSFLFFELFGFEPSASSLEIGGLQWTAGLGFVM